METVSTIEVAVCYGEPFVAAGLCAIIAAQPGLRIGAPPHLPACSPMPSAAPVVVADYGNALALAEAMRARCGNALHAPAILLLSERQSEWDIRQAFAHGVHGYQVLGGAVHELIAGVRAVHAGERYVCAAAARQLAAVAPGDALTRRENEVLRLVAQGHRNKEVACRLGLSAETVKSHLAVIFQKLGAASRMEAAAVAQRRGMLQHPGPAAQIHAGRGSALV